MTIRYAGKLMLTFRYAGKLMLTIRYAGKLMLTIRYAGKLMLTIRYAGKLMLTIRYAGKLMLTRSVQRYHQKCINLLKRINNFLTLDMKQLFYNSYIAPCFDYGCISWNNCKSAFINKITKVTKTSCLYNFEKPRKTCSKSNFTSLKWLSIKGHRKYFTILMV